MEWLQIIAIIVTFVGLFTWNRTESRNDQKHMDNKFEGNRKETLALIKAIELEMKDFHGRLIAIEERNRK